MYELSTKEKLIFALIEIGVIIGGFGLVIGQLAVDTNTLGQGIFTAIFALLMAALVIRWVENLRRSFRSTPSRVPDHEPWGMVVVALWVLAVVLWLFGIGLVIQVIIGTIPSAVGNMIGCLGYAAATTGVAMLVHMLRNNYVNSYPSDDE